MKLLVDRLGENDRVAIVVYAGSTGLALPSTTADDKTTILSALDRLDAGGSTNGGDGIRLAYNVALDHLVKGGVNRVVLCTDGDFNVGTTSQSELVSLIEDKAKSGVFLSVLGFGSGNYKDSTMEKLADKGNGNYAYIDTLREARKALVEQMTGTLVTIAKDVKIQVDFNPAHVAAYRLIGYENRVLRAEDFKDDKKDAGEIGAGHTVTALYEIVPAGEAAAGADVDPSKYQKPVATTESAASSDEMLTVRLRYKAPDGDVSTPLEFPLVDSKTDFRDASADFRFASCVASFGMLLRGSEHAGDATFDGVLETAQAGLGADSDGYRAEFVELVKAAKTLKQ
jgi:Ca-activated chloride channel family protein